MAAQAVLVVDNGRALNAIQFTATDECAEERSIDGHQMAFQQVLFVPDGVFELTDFYRQGGLRADAVHGVSVQQGRVRHRGVLGNLNVVRE